MIVKFLFFILSVIGQNSDYYNLRDVLFPSCILPDDDDQPESPFENISFNELWQLKDLDSNEASHTPEEKNTPSEHDNNINVSECYFSNIQFDYFLPNNDAEIKKQDSELSSSAMRRDFDFTVEPETPATSTSYCCGSLHSCRCFSTEIIEAQHFFEEYDNKFSLSETFEPPSTSSQRVKSIDSSSKDHSTLKSKDESFDACSDKKLNFSTQIEPKAIRYRKSQKRKASEVDTILPKTSAIFKMRKMTTNSIESALQLTEKHDDASTEVQPDVSALEQRSKTQKQKSELVFDPSDPLKHSEYDYHLKQCTGKKHVNMKYAFVEFKYNEFDIPKCSIKKYKFLNLALAVAKSEKTFHLIGTFDQCPNRNTLFTVIVPKYFKNRLQIFSGTKELCPSFVKRDEKSYYLTLSLAEIRKNVFHNPNVSLNRKGLDTKTCHIPEDFYAIHFNQVIGFNSYKLTNEKIYYHFTYFPDEKNGHFEQQADEFVKKSL